MMIKQKVLDALNKQMNLELHSSYLYLSMSAHFESANLSGFASWLRIQSAEEYQHAMKIFDFIHQVDGKVGLSGIETPKSSWSSPAELFQDVYEHEKSVTASIYKLVDLAAAEKDHAAANLLQWFVGEQIEEEATAQGILEKIKLLGESKNSLFFLDREMGKRQ